VTPTRRTAVTVVGVVVVFLGVALLAWRAVDDGSSRAAAASTVVVSGVGPADPPFESLTAGTIRVGGHRVEVVVADSLGERVQGLRGRPDPAPYEGMLFVFPSDSTVAFTMAGVPDALDIAFFDARGRRVDRLRMEPCAGTDATCPVYEADGPFRFALETAPGEMPSGRLRVGGSG
jgi:uncharacterized membrane protein (UPF0127 family)